MIRILTWTKAILTTVLGLSLAGCATHAGEGALIGGGLGAATGAAIGSLSHARAGEGALIGGAIGAIAGGLIGHEQDNRDRIRYLESTRGDYPPPRARYYETRTYEYAPPPPPPRVEVRRYYYDAPPPYYEYRETRRYYPY